MIMDAGDALVRTFDHILRSLLLAGRAFVPLRSSPFRCVPPLINLVLQNVESVFASFLLSH